MNMLGLPLDMAKAMPGIAPFRVEYLPNLWLSEDEGDWRIVRQAVKGDTLVLTAALFARLREGPRDE